jgi:hypothetical protein
MFSEKSVWSGEVLENVRFRINIAPNSFASFSTDTHLLSIIVK